MGRWLGNASSRLKRALLEKSNCEWCQIGVSTTVHRFYAWHIMHKILEKFDSIATKCDAISEFNSIVYDSKFAKEFEERWNAWIKKNNLSKNK